VEEMRIITFIMNNKGQFSYTNKIEDRKLKKAFGHKSTSDGDALVVMCGRNEDHHFHHEQ
jgi:hypothetical protein